MTFVKMDYENRNLNHQESVDIVNNKQALFNKIKSKDKTNCFPQKYKVNQRYLN